MKAGRCPLPWEERSFQAASPSPPHRPRLAATAAAPCRAARCLSKPRAENIRHCNHRVWFCFHPMVGSRLRASPPQPRSMSLLQFHRSRSVCSFSVQGRGSRVLAASTADPVRGPGAAATGSYRAHGARLPELGGCSRLCCWRGLLWFGAVAQTRPQHQHGAEPVLGSSELSTMHRAEGTPLLAGTGREWKERCQESPIPWGKRGCPSASTLGGGCTSVSTNLAPSPGPLASTAHWLDRWTRLSLRTTAAVEVRQCQQHQDGNGPTGPGRRDVPGMSHPPLPFTAPRCRLANTAEPR